MKFAWLLAAFLAQPLVSEDVLEPSVANEVDHALGRAPTNASPITVKGDLLGTNGLTKTKIALKLVSSQNSAGRWVVGTNDVTRLAVEILESL